MDLSVIVTAPAGVSALAKTMASLAAQTVPAEWNVVAPVGEEPPVPALFPAPVKTVPFAADPGTAKNRGLMVADGAYVLFLTAGDELRPGALAAALGEARKEDADLVVFDYETVSPSGEIAYVSASPEEAGEMSAEAYLYSAPVSCNKLIRRRIFVDEGLRFPEGIRFDELALIPALMAWGEKIRYLKEPLCRRPLSFDPETTPWDPSEMDVIGALDRLIRLTAAWRPEAEVVAFRRLYGETAPRAWRAGDRDALAAIAAFTAEKMPRWEKEPLIRKEPRKLRRAAALYTKAATKKK